MAKKKQSLVVSLAVYAAANLVLGVFLYFFWGIPAFREEARVRSSFALAQQRLDQTTGLIRSLPNPAKARADIEKSIAEFKKAGSSGRQLPRLIQSLGTAAQQHKVKVLSIRPREDIKSSVELPAGVNKLYVEMTLECPYQTLAEFSRALQELPARFTIEQVDARRNKDRAELSVSMLVSAFMVWEL